MARKRNTRNIVVPAGVVGTHYNHATKTYVAVRKDGSLTVGHFNKPGTNVSIG